MEFKEVTNTRTGKKSFYVDNTKVSEYVYSFKTLLCRRTGNNYNSSLTYRKNNGIYNVYSMN